MADASRRIQSLSPLPAWISLSAIGAFVAVIVLWNFSREIGNMGLGIGPVVTVLLGLSLVIAVEYASNRIRRSGMTATQQWTVVLSGLGGGAFTAASQGVTVGIRAIEHRPVTEPVLPLVVVGTLGVLGGVVIGQQYVQVRQMKREAEESRDVMAFTNSLLRHDVRNALQIIAGHVSVLRNHDDEQIRESGQTIESQTNSIDSLLEEVESIIEVLTGEVDAETVDLTEVLTEVVEQSSEGYPKATIELDLPDRLLVDGGEALHSVFTNLVKNAVQHADRPAVRVRVMASEAADTVTVRVADNGPGVPEEDRDRIFEQGVSTDGDGHGLYVAQTIVEALDGHMTVEESELDGAAFVVEFPAAGDHNAQEVEGPVIDR